MKIWIYAWRFLKHAKSYVWINLLGLSLSLACCIILVRYLYREQTVDVHCVDRDHVYGVKVIQGGNSYLGTYGGYIENARIDPSHVKARTQVRPLQGSSYVTKDGNRFFAKAIATDSMFLRLFPYPVHLGKVSLSAPNSAILLKDFADSVFGTDVNPIGKTLRFSNGKDIVVEGVLDRPANKVSMTFDLIVSSQLSEVWDGAMPMEFYSFFPETDMRLLEEEARKPRQILPYDDRKFSFSFVPVKDIYWDQSIQYDSTGQSDMFSTGNRTHFQILCGVCLLLLLVGILNFVNLYLVMMMKRAKELDLKRVYGAGKHDLFLQIWSENQLLTVISMLLAWIIIECVQPFTSFLFGYTQSYLPLDGWISVGILVLLPLLLSVYPYMKYTFGCSVVSLRSIGSGIRSTRSRMAFLCFQYVLTFLLLFLAFYFNRQLKLLLETDLGFRTEDVLIARLNYNSGSLSSPEDFLQQQQRLKVLGDKLNACPDIEIWDDSYADILTGDMEAVFLNDKGERITLNMRMASPRFFDVFDIPFAEGGLPENVSEVNGLFAAVVLNRAAMEALGYTDLSGAVLTETVPMMTRGLENNTLSVSAVVEDYYGGHLTLGKKPTVYFVGNLPMGEVYQIACAPGKIHAVVDYLRNVEKEIYGSEDFEYRILEDTVRDIYAEDRRVASVYQLFAVMSVLVSVLGLFGISLFDLRRRYREIGIRKVNGAQPKDLYLLLFRQYIGLLLLSCLIATPVALFLIEQYTEHFAVKASIGVGGFLAVFLSVALVSLGTLYWQICQILESNPAEVIKSE